MSICYSIEMESLWSQMLKQVRSKEAKAEVPKSKLEDPQYMDAQRRSTSYYFQTGEERPLEDFVRDKKLGKN